MKWLLLVGGLSACAFTAPDNHPAGDGVDAPTSPPGADARPDAPATSEPVTLQQTADMTVAGGHSVTCTSKTTGVVLSNGWYRVFDLADHQISGVFRASKVSFAVELASGSPELTIDVGTYSGTGTGSALSLSKITALATARVTVPDSGAAVIDVPLAVDVPAGSKLIVKIATPSLAGTGKRILLGSTTGAETRAGFAQAASCNFGDDTPVSVTTIRPDSHLLITVTGTR
jgi:hypothetical protein